MGASPTTDRRPREGAWHSPAALGRAARALVVGVRVGAADGLPDAGHGELDASYLPRAVDDRLAELLASQVHPVVVVTGPPSAGVTRTAAHAVRRTRSDDLFVELDDPYQGSLEEVVERARRRASPSRPALIWCDDAPLTLLDQVRGDVLAACSQPGGDGRSRVTVVRLVLTVRWGLPTLSRGELAASRFAPVVVAPVTPAEVVGRESHELVADRGVSGLAGRRIGELVAPVAAAREAFAGPSGDVVRLVAVWHRLGIPTALGPEVLAALRPDDADGDLTEIVTGLVEQGWLRRTVRGGQRHLAPARVLVDLARLPSDELVACIAGHLDHHARYLAARTMLASGLDSLAAVMVADLEPDPLGPVAALRVARGFAGLERDREAAQWFAFVIAVGDEDQARAAHRGLGLVFYRYDRLDRARRHLDRAADQLGVQVVLADIALRQGRVADARALLALLRRSRDPALAAEAACQLGTLESSTGRPDAARAAFTEALGAVDPAVVARARTGLSALPPRVSNAAMLTSSDTGAATTDAEGAGEPEPEDSDGPSLSPDEREAPPTHDGEPDESDDSEARTRVVPLASRSRG
ncbi:tetratricopeptide repeat protein [Actinomycetospora termitidis]|uniref:Tetratricopeptide repeat protein n=1 Tax=Actinomycetospora termitidis TaxID=3053470 RepID=A0ABT7MG94_9PSEU|nr:tetratricopeptide repeat protein [Actinomycetospora sp. Odt1-22]MDL5159179.1 hypothetical protein [Actinomycetospora sp. Odt1-22]